LNRKANYWKMGTEGDEFSYIRIRDSDQFRRNILECLKDIISLLQKHEQIKRIREEKIKTIMQLKDILLELAKLNSQLRLELPKVKVVIRRNAVKASPGVKSVVEVRKTNQFDLLESELEDIESKLKALV